MSIIEQYFSLVIYYNQISRNLKLWFTLPSAVLLFSSGSCFPFAQWQCEFWYYRLWFMIPAWIYLHDQNTDINRNINPVMTILGRSMKVMSWLIIVLGKGMCEVIHCHFYSETIGEISLITWTYPEYTSTTILLSKFNYIWNQMSFENKCKKFHTLLSASKFHLGYNWWFKILSL